MRAVLASSSSGKESTVKKFVMIAGALVLCAHLAVPAATLAGDETSTTATGVSRAMNPAISVNSLVMGQVSRDDDSVEANTIDLQEMEMQFTSIVDPFWKADLVVAVHPEHGHDGEEAHGYAVDLEVARLEYLNMPRGLGLTLGKDYVGFGKHLPLQSPIFQRRRRQAAARPRQMTRDKHQHRRQPHHASGHRLTSLRSRCARAGRRR